MAGRRTDATLAPKPTPVPVALPVGRRAISISVGYSHACAVLDDGSARCWGSDGFGQLGDDAALAQQPTPVAVALPSGRRAVAISAGGFHTCALLDDGSAVCWGGDSFGQLGDDALFAQQPTPAVVALPAGRRAAAIGAGGVHTCALLDDGSAACWGADVQGGLGDDAPLANKATPVAVALPAGRRTTAISAGGSHACAVLDDGSLACWGRDGEGELGDDAPLADKATPVLALLPTGRRVVAVSAGRFHTCAILDDGSGRCWGSDAQGQLGNGADGTQQPIAKDAPAALPAASTVGRAADLSLTVEGSVAQLDVGASRTLVVRVANGGADPATGIRVLLDGSRLDLAPLTISQGTLAGGFWQVGTLQPGADAALALSVTPVAAGTAVLTAEVAGQVERDPDSTPANGAAGEDDRATATIAVAAPAAPPPPPPPPAAKAKADRLTLALAADRDTSAPHRAKVTGRLVAATVSDQAGCRGSITVTAKAGKRTLARRTVRLKAKDGACEYAATLTISARQRGNATSAQVAAAFPGNDALLPVTSRTRTFRLS